MKIETLIVPLETDKIFDVVCGSVMSVKAGYNHDNPQEHLLLIRNFGTCQNKKAVLLSPYGEVKDDIKFVFVCDVYYKDTTYFFFVEDKC